jgi:hypothetical protein
MSCYNFWAASSSTSSPCSPPKVNYLLIASVSSIKLGFFKNDGTNFLPGTFFPLRGAGAINVDSSSWREEEIYSSTDDAYYC